MDYLTNVLDQFTGSIGGNLSSALGALIYHHFRLVIAGLLKKVSFKLLKKTGVDNKIKIQKLVFLNLLVN